MSRGEVGARPLLIEVIRRTISYMKDIQRRKDSLVYKAWDFELNNNIIPNFITFIDKFNLNNNDIINEGNKREVKKTCYDKYDRFWKMEVDNSPKALSYKTFKANVNFEKYLFEVKSVKYRIALSRFRLSNHTLMIEKGRHMRPQINRNDRKCGLCTNEIENEFHFVIVCPLYEKERVIPFQSCRENSKYFDNGLNEEQKFIFIMTNECPKIIRTLAKFVYNSFIIREIKIPQITNKS